MQEIFSDGTMSLAYYIEISAAFLITMFFFLDQKAYRKHKWVHHLGFCLLVAWWILALASQTLTTKMYATLMLVSTIIIEVIIRRKRKSLP